MYITESELEIYSGLNIDNTISSWITSLITACTEWVEKTCGGGVIAKRVFEAPTPDDVVTRYYNGNGCTRLMIDDLRDITSLTIDAVAQTEDEDFYLYPLNASADGLPYQWIELIQPENAVPSNPRAGMASYEFEVGQKNIVVAGKWGYSATVPQSIKLAVMKLALGVIKENISDSDVKELNSENIGQYSVSYASVSAIANKLKLNEWLAPYIRERLPKKSGGSVEL